MTRFRYLTILLISGMLPFVAKGQHAANGLDFTGFNPDTAKNAAPVQVKTSKQYDEADSLLMASHRWVPSDGPHRWLRYDRRRRVNRALMPHVFSGYRSLANTPLAKDFLDPAMVTVVWESLGKYGAERILLPSPPDSTGHQESILSRSALTVAFGSATPGWLHDAMIRNRFEEDLLYESMVKHPEIIDYAYWDLPVPPRLPEEDYSFKGFLRRLDLPEVDTKEKIATEVIKDRYNWLHTLNTGLQLSQAYVSDNWYQGGASYVAFFTNFQWDVQLNPVFYPKLMFQSTVSYKLAINSTPDDKYHKYSISQDLFQYNLKLGYKAIHNWYYSFTTIFKTQFCCSYPSNSMDRKASFLSPSELNLGVGMTYSKSNNKKTLVFSTSIAPVSYNMKACIDPKVNKAQFGIDDDKKVKNEFGSNAEINFQWKMRDNITYSTKMYLFTDYDSFQGDWENTLNFQFNRFFSTQVYAHLRYDTLADTNISPKWHKWMLKEILSVGLSYIFSTK